MKHSFKCLPLFLIVFIALIISLSGCSTTTAPIQKESDRDDASLGTLGAGIGALGGLGAGIGALIGGSADYLSYSHLWTYLSKLGHEPIGYAIYTYVLVGRDATDAETWDRYNELVKSIMSSTTSTSDIPKNLPEEIDRSNYNIFLIPYSADKKLNVRLSKSIMTMFSANSGNDKLRRSLTNPGPFLISMIQPLRAWEKSKKFDVLYVDLTKTNKAAMNEIVKAYKSRLTKSEIQKTEELLSVKLAALNLILNVDDYIQIIKVTYANLLPDSP